MRELKYHLYISQYEHSEIKKILSILKINYKAKANIRTPLMMT